MGCLVEQVAEGFVVLPVFLSVLHHGVGIAVAVGVGGFGGTEHHRVHLLLPVLLV